MRKIFFGVLFIVLPAILFSQTVFNRALQIPVVENGDVLRFPWAGGINFPKLSEIDLNGDNSPDIFIFDSYNNRIQTFINNGNTAFDLAWDYAPEYISQFPPVKFWAFLYDYNCDGKADFFTASSAFQCSGIAVYRNNYIPGSGFNWTLVDSCLKETYVTIQQNIFTNSVSLPHFNDIDGDGDMDILGYNTVPNGRILYHKNVSMENYGTCDSLEFVLASLCWGNFQLKIGGTNTVGCFQCPCRMGRPVQNFVAGDEVVSVLQEPVADQSEAARRDDTVSSIFAIDVDGNGFMDLLVGDIAANNTLMIHNNGTEMDTQDTLFPSSNIPAEFNGFHYHAYMDVDNDGRKDLLVVPNDNSNTNAVWLYKNTGTTSSPIFNRVTTSFLQSDMIDAGELACPVLFDYDGDSLLDMVISKAVFDSLNGNYRTGLYLYENTGTTSSPIFELINTDFAGLTGPNLYAHPIYPAFGDLDNDGDLDMLLGVTDGRLHFYENIAGSGNPATYSGPVVNYMSIDVGNFATPQLYDINSDGLLDIISGGQRGFVWYFKNSGSLTAPFFNSVPSTDTLGCIVLQAPGTTDGYTVPFLYDSLGTTRLLVANGKGNIYQYSNIDGNLNGCFSLTGTVYNPAESARVQFNLTVSGGDLNADGYTDIIIGQATGGAEIRYQRNPFSEIPESENVKPQWEAIPNPFVKSLQVKMKYPQIEQALIRIYNSKGTLILQKFVRGEEAVIQTDEWPSGIYFLQVMQGNNMPTGKVIVKQ